MRHEATWMTILNLRPSKSREHAEVTILVFLDEGRSVHVCPIIFL
jgi:hypothetical protein